MKHLVRVRVIVEQPPTGVRFAVQRGHDELERPIAEKNNALIFQFPVLVADPITDPPRLLGEFTQGPPTARFLYVNSGTYAGQSDSCWSRRAKVSLMGLTAELIQAALDKPDLVLQTRLAGTGKDGGPTCASVKALAPWTVEAV